MLHGCISRAAAPAAAGAVGFWRLRRAYSSTAGSQQVSTFTSFTKNYPMAFSCGIACAKGVWADVVAQKTIEQRETLDYRRLAAFATFGLVYMGGVQYIIYVKIFAERIFTSVPAFAAKTLGQKLQDFHGCGTVVAQVVLDQGFVIPFIFFPFFYTIKTAILGDPEERAARGSTLFQTAFETYSGNLKEDMLTSWSTFLPMNVVNFFLMPMHLRIPVMTVCSAAYCVLLSYMRGAEEPRPTDQALQFQSVLRLAQEKGLCDMTKMNTALKTYIDKSTGALNKQGFMSFFNDIGIVDPQSLESLYEVFDIDKDGKVTMHEFTSALFALAGFGTPEETALFIFRACDLDNNNQLEKQELFVMIRSMLRMRERLLINMSADRATNIVAGASNDKDTSNAARLKTLKARKSCYSNLTSIEAILHKEAEDTADAIFEECDANKDKIITLDEFSTWVKKETPTWRTFHYFFKAFAPKPVIGVV